MEIKVQERKGNKKDDDGGLFDVVWCGVSQGDDVSSSSVTPSGAIRSDFGIFQRVIFDSVSMIKRTF